LLQIVRIKVPSALNTPALVFWGEVSVKLNGTGGAASAWHALAISKAKYIHHRAVRRQGFDVAFALEGVFMAPAVKRGRPNYQATDAIGAAEKEMRCLDGRDRRGPKRILST
jgi:hypothetical protein